MVGALTPTSLAGDALVYKLTYTAASRRTKISNIFGFSLRNSACSIYGTLSILYIVSDLRGNFGSGSHGLIEAEAWVLVPFFWFLLWRVVCIREVVCQGKEGADVPV